MKVQRLRLTFVRGDEARELSHREIMRALEQAMRKAGLPLAYSEGRRHTAQISIGAPLPLGATSACELADLPSGLEALSALEVGLEMPALQTQLRWAEYEVDVPRGGRSPDDIRRAINDILAARSLPWEHRRETKVLHYDLRPLVLELRLEAEADEVYLLVMRLCVNQERSGRADQVVAALGLDPPSRVHRRCLYVNQTSPVVTAYRCWNGRG
jgi:uncharacterized protein (DUF2344 family)